MPQYSGLDPSVMRETRNVKILVLLSLNEKSQIVLVTQMIQHYNFACNQPEIQQQVHSNAAQILLQLCRPNDRREFYQWNTNAC